MEKPLIEQFDFNPKTKVEENSFFKVDISGVEVNTTKKNFEYSEQIQRETGILGYERIKISLESIFDVFKKFSEKKGVSLKEYSIDSVDDFQKVLEDKNNSWQKYNKIFLLEEPFMNELLLTISEGEYPNQTYNHKLGGYSGSDERIKMGKDFKDDKFFLQKIYDVDRIEKKLNEGNSPQRIFNYPASYDFQTANSNFTLYKKETGEKTKDAQHIGEIANYKDKIGREYYAATPQGGLNVQAGHFWRGIDFNSVGFGFPVFKDSLFREYIEKSLEILLKTEEIEVYREHIYPRIIEDILMQYAMSEYERQGNLLGGTKKDGWNEDNFGNKIKEILDNFIVSKNIGNILNKTDFNRRNLYLKLFYRRGAFENFTIASDDLYLPIFIGHSEVPQLSWGHAKYAHFFNKKGLNFFKFKHSDHLPIKEQKNQ